MSTSNPDSLPNWTFHVDEVSAGVYKLQAKHASGTTIELTGTDPNALLERARKSAQAMERQLKAKKAKSS